MILRRGSRETTEQGSAKADVRPTEHVSVSKFAKDLTVGETHLLFKLNMGWRTFRKTERRIEGLEVSSGVGGHGNQIMSIGFILLGSFPTMMLLLVSRLLLLVFC